MKQKILVAGGTGYIGSHTTVELQNAGYEVVIIDDLSNSNIEVLDGIERITGIRPEFIKLDLKDKEGTREALKAHPGIKGIILFAASKAVGESVQQPLKYYRNNVVTLVNLLELMPEFNIEGIVFSSSCTVYGQPDPENLPVTENAPIKPATSPYGNTKQINEEIIRDTIHAGAPFKSIILRYFNPIGAHPTAEIGELPNGVPQNLRRQCKYTLCFSNDSSNILLHVIAVVTGKFQCLLSSAFGNRKNCSFLWFHNCLVCSFTCFLERLTKNNLINLIIMLDRLCKPTEQLGKNNT